MYSSYRSLSNPLPISQPKAQIPTQRMPTTTHVRISPRRMFIEVFSLPPWKLAPQELSHHPHQPCRGATFTPYRASMARFSSGYGPTAIVSGFVDDESQ